MKLIIAIAVLLSVLALSSLAFFILGGANLANQLGDINRRKDDS